MGSDANSGTSVGTSTSGAATTDGPESEGPGTATNTTDATNTTHPTTDTTDTTNTSDPTDPTDPTTGESTDTSPTTDPETDSDSSTTGTVCQPMMADCNNDPDDGCEVDTNTHVLHCGGCNSPCEGACLDGQCKPGKLVFLTSKTYTGQLNSTTGADDRCGELASEVGLPGTYKAWISDPQDDPDQRFTHANEPYLLLNGQVIANGWEDLVDGQLNVPITVDENGVAFDSVPTCEGKQVWSNTNPNGTGYSEQGNCIGWTVESPSNVGHVGVVGATTAKWSNGECSVALCNIERHLYCFGQ